MSGTVIHIAGPTIQIGPQRRQRCSWCGAVIDDYDLSRTAVAIQYDEDGKAIPWDGPAEWPVGGLVARDGNVTWVIEHNPGVDRLPEGSCGLLPFDVTGGRNRD